MRTSSAKAKGRRLQQELQQAILEAFPELEPEDVVNRPMGSQGEDLIMSPKASQVFPFSPECKNVERLNIWAALKQAATNAGKKIPLLVFRKNRTEPYVALPLKDFMELVKKSNWAP